MNNRAFYVLTIAVVSFWSFVSCNKDTPDNTEGTELIAETSLTREKGWTLSEAECPGGYEICSGGYAISDYITITNLFDGYFWECEEDDIIKFDPDGSEYLNPGTLLCEDQSGQEEFLGEWALDVNNRVLNMQIPFFYDDKVENCTLIRLVESQLKVQYVFSLTEETAKAQAGTYTFILTYVPAK